MDDELFLTLIDFDYDQEDYYTITADLIEDSDLDFNSEAEDGSDLEENDESENER